MESFFTLLFLDKKKQKSRLASSATSHCTLRDAGRTTFGEIAPLSSPYGSDSFRLAPSLCRTGARF
ncbi:MAG: hypothetical protein LBQ60_12090, partial [Bacteroidales bacterium]|nr:hypothetical protein [Bacteroidales bacterium]